MKSSASQSSKWLPNTIFALIGLSLLFSGWLGWQQFDLRNHIASAQAENRALEQTIEGLENQDVGTLFAANQILESAIAARIEWSEVAKNILGIAATDSALGFDQVQIDLSGQVSVSGESEGLKNIAVLLQELRNDDRFSGPFVPSIGGAPGRYNFQLQFTYLNL